MRSERLREGLKALDFVLGAVVLAFVVNLVSNPPLPAVLKPLQRHEWWVLLCLLLLLGLRAVQRSRETTPEHLIVPSERWVRLRPQLIARVHRDWVAGVLDPSLTLLPAPLTVRLQERPDTVAARLGLTEPQSRGPLDAQAAPIAAYELAGGRLLVLGQPGTGKTTLLLRMAQELLERASSDAAAPIPVVFHAATWDGKVSLSKWLVVELQRRYGVPAAAARSYIQYGEVVPLLDGLDELAEPQRAACAAAINAYRQQRELLPFVACCRTSEYEALAVTLCLETAVEVQPLSAADVRRWAGQLGAEGARLRRLLADDPALLDLVTTPLLLGVAAAVAASGQGRSLTRARTRQERRRILFDLYVEQALTQTPRSRLAVRRPPFKPAETRWWLARLAAQLHIRDLAIFYPDWIQADWLPRRGQRLVVIQGIQLFPAVVVAASIPWTTRLSMLESISAAVGAALLLSGLILMLRFDESISPVTRVHWSRPQLRSNLRAMVLFLDLLFAVLAWRVLESGVRGIRGLLALVVLVEPIIAFVSWGMGGHSETGEALGEPVHGWTAISYALLSMARNAYLILEMIALPYVVGKFLFGHLDEVTRAEIRQQFSSASLHAYASYIPLAVVTAGAFLLWNHVVIAYAQRGLLRLFLIRSKMLPRRLPEFLESANAHLLLLRVGRGYLFMHQLFLDHLAGEAGALSSSGVLPLSGRASRRAGVWLTGLSALPFAVLAFKRDALGVLLGLSFLFALAEVVTFYLGRSPLITEVIKLPKADWEVPYLGIPVPQLEYPVAPIDRRVRAALHDPCIRARLLASNASLIDAVTALAHSRNPEQPVAELHSSITAAVLYGLRLAEDSPDSILDGAIRGALRSYSQGAPAHNQLALYAACTSYMMSHSRKTARRKLLRRLRRSAQATTSQKRLIRLWRT